MERVVRLLEERNHYLEKFHSLNQSQLDRMEAGDFEQVDQFYKSREGILDNISHLERLLEVQLRAFPEAGDTISPEIRQMASDALVFRDGIVKSILDQDLAIISLIEEAKSQIIRELSDIRKGRSVIKGYRSPNRETQLDEKV